MYLTIVGVLWAICFILSLSAVIIEVGNKIRGFINDEKDTPWVLPWYYYFKPVYNTRTISWEDVGNLTSGFVVLGGVCSLIWPVTLIAALGYGLVYGTRYLVRMKKKVDKLTTSEAGKG